MRISNMYTMQVEHIHPPISPISSHIYLPPPISQLPCPVLNSNRLC